MKLFLSVMILALSLGAAAYAGEAGQQKILIAYFSKTNNTRSVAEQIQASVGGDTFQIRTSVPYPQDYRETTVVARAELDENRRPELAETLPAAAMRDYDVIFVGYPIWWGTAPMAVFTFLEQFDFTGKIVIPFCTHEGSGMGGSARDIAAASRGASVCEGLALRGRSASQAGNDIAAWLRRLGFVQ